MLRTIRPRSSRNGASQGYGASASGVACGSRCSPSEAVVNSGIRVTVTAPICHFNKWSNEFDSVRAQAFLIVRPPSTGKATPVMKLAAGSTRDRVPCATSSGSA